MKPLLERLESNSIPEPNSGCLLWLGGRNQKGYGLTKWHEGKTRCVSRLIWKAYYGPIPGDLCVCHHCDTPLCINIEHLFLGTDKDNKADSIAKGRNPDRTGKKNGRAKITDHDVVAIRASNLTRQKLAQQYGLCKNMIGLIRKRRNWKHVE